jgi:Bacterial Ig-like domain (group 3)/MBG domain (YGX type)
MNLRVLGTAASSLCLVLLATTAHAQIASSCLRPLAIPDKWVENQTPPWDPSDSFDPTSPNPDVYLTGFQPSTDHGTPMELVLYQGNFTGRAALPVRTGEAGGAAFRLDILTCSGYLFSIGDSLPLATGSLVGVFNAAMNELIAQDPNAFWDPGANGGKGGVSNSAYAQSPRVIALPVFAPDSYASTATTSSLTVVKIVGFFVSQQTTEGVQGFLTGWSQLTTTAVSARPGEWAALSASFTGPGSPVAGVPIEFLVNDAVVATAQTDGTGTARPPTMSYNTGSTLPGNYPGAVRARLGEDAGFFIADDGSADLTILRALPVITWPAPAAVFYGTPLGGPQLNAAADVSGQFSYAPAPGTVLHAGENQAMTATFVPADLQQYEEVSATNYLTVIAAPLSVAVTSTTKLYLDPLPTFGLAYTGFVNGDGPSVVLGSPSFQTSATAASGVGVYPVSISGLTAADYMLTTSPGVLTIAPRPTATTVQLSGPNPTTYGQSLSITVVVSSGIGTPNGNVTLFDAATPVATAALVNAQVTFNLTSLSAGSHSLSVQYSGDGGFAPSTSTAVTQSVLTAKTTTQLTSSVNPSRTGEAVVFTAAVSPVSPGGGVPTGSVEFIRAGVVVATAPLNSGTALFTINSLPVGKHQFQARYVGSPNHAGSASVVLQQTVKGGK